MAFRRACAAVRATTVSGRGEKEVTRSIGFEYSRNHCPRLVNRQKSTTCDGSAAAKNKGAGGSKDTRISVTASLSPANLGRGMLSSSLASTSSAATTSVELQQQQHHHHHHHHHHRPERGHPPPTTDGLAVPAPSSTPTGAAAAAGAVEAAAGRPSPASFPDPVSVFPLDSDLHREIGAAVDTELHRRLGPEIAAVHQEVVKEKVEDKAAATAVAAEINFDDTAVSYASFTNTELLRAYMVLRACAIRPLVEHSETLMKIGYGVIGENLTNAILGKTFYAHFCAGETAEQVGRRARALKMGGIGGILDYAAEVDLRPAKERAEREAKKRAAGDDRLLLEEPAACRTYDYMGEAACDARLMTFLTCVQAVRDQTPGGFAAVKLTALGDPVLLSQIATCARLVRRLFEDFDGDRDGLVTHEDFKEGYRRWFVCETEEEKSTLLDLMRRLDAEGTGVIDYVGWSNEMRLDNLAEIAAYCRNMGPMATAALSENDVALKKSMYRRIATLATAAAAAEVRLMIDAEQSWLQPAIDNEVYSLQLEFNKEFPTIFTTYQCYLKDALDRLETDLDRAARGGYVWAGKLVRGAYMVSERERAREEGYESPVFDTIEETHASYDAAVDKVLHHMARGNRAEVMMATHNQASIEHAIGLMQRLGIRRQDGVSFGQLLGMADNITFPLGAGGYKVYKYIPYGKVGETIPYLLRRAQENSGMLGGASHERGLLIKEIRRRVFG